MGGGGLLKVWSVSHQHVLNNVHDFLYSNVFSLTVYFGT